MRREMQAVAATALVLLAALVAGEPSTAQGRAVPVRSVLRPFATKTIEGEVRSVGEDWHTLVVRVRDDEGRPRDVAVRLDDRTVLKERQMRISGGDLSPGLVVRVTYSNHAGKLVARRIAVTRKAAHPLVP